MWFFLSIYFAIWTSISTFIVKKLTKTISPFSIYLVTNLFIIPFMLILIYFMGGFPQVTTSFYMLIFSSSILDIIAFISSLFAIKLAPISLVSPISSVNPLFTTIIAIFTLNEVPTIPKFLGIITIVIGMYLLNIKDIKHGLFKPFQNLFTNKGVQLFFLANFLWAITPSFQKPAIFQTTPNMPLYVSFFGIILITLYVIPFAIKPVKNNFKDIKENIIWFLIIGIFATLAQFAGFTAFSLANVGYVTAIFKLSPLFTILWGAIFLKEERIQERLLGASVMIIGTILLVV